MINNVKCCICNKEIIGINKTDNYCCDECWKKYVESGLKYETSND